MCGSLAQLVGQCLVAWRHSGGRREREREMERGGERERDEGGRETKGKREREGRVANIQYAADVRV